MKNAALLRLTAISLLLALGVVAFSFFLFCSYWSAVYPVTSDIEITPLAPWAKPPSAFSSQSLHSNAVAIRFSSNSRYLLVAGGTGDGVIKYQHNGEWQIDMKSRDKRLRLFSVTSGTELERLNAKPNSAQYYEPRILLMPDFKTMITGSGGSGLKVIDIRKRYPDRRINIYNGNLGDVALSPDGNILVVGMTREVQFRDAKTFRLLRIYEHGGQGTSINFGRDSRIIRCSWAGMKSHYVDTSTVKQVRVPYGTREFDVTFSADGKYFAEVVGNDQVVVWQHDTKQSFQIGSVKSSLAGITMVQFSPDNKTLAVGGASSTENPVQFFKLADLRKNKIVR